MYENNLGLTTSTLNVKIDALSNLTWKQMKRKVRQYFVEHYMNYCQGLNKCMKKEKGEMNTLVYMGKRWALVRVKPKFFLWQRALSEHV